jgi:hypothetical protein
LAVVASFSALAVEDAVFRGLFLGIPDVWALSDVCDYWDILSAHRAVSPVEERVRFLLKWNASAIACSLRDRL